MKLTLDGRLFAFSCVQLAPPANANQVPNDRWKSVLLYEITSRERGGCQLSNVWSNGWLTTMLGVTCLIEFLVFNIIEGKERYTSEQHWQSETPYHYIARYIYVPVALAVSRCIPMCTL